MGGTEGRTKGKRERERDRKRENPKQTLHVEPDSGFNLMSVLS